MAMKGEPDKAMEPTPARGSSLTLAPLTAPIAMIRVLLLLLLLSAHAVAEPPKIPVDDAGRWTLPLRYWSHWRPFECGGCYAFLAEVTKLDPVEKPKSPRFYRGGWLRVHELLSPKPASPPEVAKVRELIVEGLDGLKVGDRVIVFVDPEPYYGGYVINFHEGGCLVGIRLPAANDLNFGAEEQQRVLKTIREGRMSLRQLTSEEMSAWIVADPAGIARSFKQELDMKRLQWKE